MNEERKIEVEEVEAVAPPPRARVEDAGVETAGDKLERKKDYLEGFLAQKPPAATPGAPGGDLYEAVVEALKEIYDPERLVLVHPKILLVRSIPRSSAATSLASL